jgi:hypothetical protein
VSEMMHVSEVGTWSGVTWREQLTQKWGRVVCMLKGHIPGMVWISGDGIFDICGRCSKSAMIGSSPKPTQKYVFWSKNRPPEDWPEGGTDEQRPTL